MTTTTITEVRGQPRTVSDAASQRPSLEESARRRLAEMCSYAFCFNQVTFRYVQGVLVLRGRLPSFYLKQVLQTLLRDLEGVERIDNQVEVVSATGLSSVRPK